jgi:hypothetical protein
MRFNYYLVGSGWANLDIEFNGNKLEYWDSLSLGGSLYDLLEGILTILEIKRDFPINDLCYNSETNKLTWLINEENATVELNFEVNKEKDKAILKIIQHYENDECIFEGEIDFIEFLNDIINSCDIILNKYGIIGFFANTLNGDDFPLTYYLLLKNYLLKEKCIKMETVIEKFNNDENENSIFKTNIDKELYLIKILGHCT